MRRNTRSVWGPVIAALLIVLAFNTVGQATHSPANKVVAAGSKVVVMQANDPAEPDPDPLVTELLSATLRTSKPTDLILAVSMECSIITDVQTGPSGTAGATDTATAEGKVRAWVTIDGKLVPINSMSEPPQNPDDQVAGEDNDKVTFCNRVHTQDAEDGENDEDGLDKLRTYLETKNANAFNWLRLNMGSGIHTIKVIGELTTNTSGHALGAEALVGNRSLIAEPAKLANDARI